MPINQINFQWNRLVAVKAMYPTMRKDMIGKQSFSTAPLYQQELGYNITFQLAEPLTEEQIEKINQTGRWANESYVVWLCALLEYYWVIPPKEHGGIDKTLEGNEEIDILRRLRNELVHRSGFYDSTSKNAKTLYERMVSKFSLRTKSSIEANRYPVHINDFLIPLTEKCENYIRALLTNPEYQKKMQNR